MYISFESLPRKEKLFLIETFGLSRMEESIITLRYIDQFSYSRIAAELLISEKSVGNTLTRARKHMVDIAKTCYPIADERTKHLIDILGWIDLEFPTLENRRKA